MVEGQAARHLEAHAAVEGQSGFVLFVAFDAAQPLFAGGKGKEAPSESPALVARVDEEHLYLLRAEAHEGGPLPLVAAYAVQLDGREIIRRQVGADVGDVRLAEEVVRGAHGAFPDADQFAVVGSRGLLYF